MTILKSQLQELAISFGDLLMPAVRSIVAGLQGMVKVLNAMPDGVKRVIMVIALLAAALGPVLIVIGKTISAIGTIMTWIPKLASAISTVKGAFAALSATMMANPIAIVIAAIAALVAAYAKKDKIVVQYFDVETLGMKTAEMYVTGYKAKLKKDTSYKGLWTVSFTLKEL